MDALTTYQTPWQRVNNFFFAREIPYGMALLRIVLPWILLLNAVPRWFHAREIYSLDGAATPLAENYGVYGISPLFSGPVVVALSTTLVFLLLTLSAGWCTRLSTIGSLVIYTYFSYIDSISTSTKYTVIATHLLLLMSVADCGAIWSVDFWLRNRRHRKEFGFDLPPDALASEVWPQRLIQLFVAVVYIGAAVTKFRTPSFFTGDQLMYWTMTHIYQSHLLGDYLSQYPILLVIGGYATILWEVAWLYCAWRAGFKSAAIIMGLGFHLMTWPMLGLVSFPLVMVCSYFAYLNTEDARRWGVLACRFRKRFAGFSSVRIPAALRCGSLISFSPLPAGRIRLAGVATFLVSMGTLAGIGIGAEHLYDPYRLRGPNGPLALKPISEAEVERLLTPSGAVREQDKYFALDLGTTMVAEHLLDRRREFRQGQQMFAQISVNPPHEDLWVQCQLYEAGTAEKQSDSAGTLASAGSLVPKKLIDQTGSVFTRDSTRGAFPFFLGENLVPGDYFFVVRSAGQIVLRKQFKLLPKSPVVVGH